MATIRRFCSDFGGDYSAEMEDSDSDMEEIPINPNHQSSIPNSIQNPNSQLKLKKPHFKHSKKHNKHNNRHKRQGAKSGFYNYNTDNYFEQARQAQLLGAQVTQINRSLNNGMDRNFAETEGENKGKGIETSDKPVNGSRFHSNKPFRKNKYVFNNNEGSSSFNSQKKVSLVRNGCISPNNVKRFIGIKSHGNSSVEHFGEHVLGANSSSKGKERVEFNDSLPVRIYEERPHESDLMKKRKQLDLMVINSSSDEEHEGSDSDWYILDGPNCKNQELESDNAKINQVESDEILARRLQEEFNREAQNLNRSDQEENEDDDAMVARVLEDSDSDDYFDDNNDNDNDDLDNVSSQEPEMQIPCNTRGLMNNFNNPDMEFEMSLITQIRRNFGGHSQMDIETRLNYLEALEAAFDHNSEMDFSDDYDMLWTLDEDNHRQVGASDNQINILPLSKIKGENSEDDCVICLATPSIGAEMRHLPCLHKFHKECIDTWLKIRNTCPVCKHSID